MGNNLLPRFVFYPRRYNKVLGGGEKLEILIFIQVSYNRRIALKNLSSLERGLFRRALGI